MTRTRADKGGVRHMAIGQGFKRVTRSTVLKDKTNNASPADETKITSPRYEDFYNQHPPNLSVAPPKTTQNQSFRSASQDQHDLPDESVVGKPYKSDVSPGADHCDPDSVMVDMPECNQVSTSSLCDELSTVRPASPSPFPSPRAPEYQRVSESPDASISVDSSLRDIQSDDEHSFKKRDGRIKLPSPDYCEEEPDQMETDFNEIDVMSTGYMPMGMTPSVRDSDDLPQGMYACSSAGLSRYQPVYSQRKRFSHHYKESNNDGPRHSRYFLQESMSSLGSDTDDRSDSSKKKSKSMISDSDNETDQLMEQEDEYRPAPPAAVMAQRRLNKSDSECMREALWMSLMDQPGAEWADPSYIKDNEEMPIDVPIAIESWEQAANAYYQNTPAPPFLPTGTFCGIGETPATPASWPKPQEAVMQEHRKSSLWRSTYLPYFEHDIVGNESEAEKEEEPEDEEREENTKPPRHGRIDSRNREWEVNSCDLDLIPDCAEDTFRRGEPEDSYNDAELKELYCTLHNHSPLYKREDDFGRWSAPSASHEDAATLLQDILRNLCLVRRLRRDDQPTADHNDHERGDRLVDALRKEIECTAAQSASLESEIHLIGTSHILSDQIENATASQGQSTFKEEAGIAE